MWWLIGSAPDYRDTSPGFESGISHSGKLGGLYNVHCTVQYSVQSRGRGQKKREKKGELAANGLAKRLF